MAEQLLRDPNVQLTEETLAAALGGRAGTYSKFTDALKMRDIVIEWRYYNDGRSWLGKGLHRWTTPRGAKKEITCFWSSVWDSFFKVSIFVRENMREDVKRCHISEETKEMIAAAKQMNKMNLFPVIFDVYDDKVLGDILALIDFKKSIK